MRSAMLATRPPAHHMIAGDSRCHEHKWESEDPEDPQRPRMEGYHDGQQPVTTERQEEDQPAEAGWVIRGAAGRPLSILDDQPALAWLDPAPVFAEAALLPKLLLAEVRGAPDRCLQ